MFFDENALAGDWRERVLHCRDNGVCIDREIAFAVAVADLLQVPDDLPLMPTALAIGYSPQPHRPTGRGHKHVPKYP